ASGSKVRAMAAFLVRSMKRLDVVLPGGYRRAGESEPAPPAKQADGVCDVVPGERAEDEQRERTASEGSRAVLQGPGREVELRGAIPDSRDEQRRQGDTQVDIGCVEETIRRLLELREAKAVPPERRAQRDAPSQG